RHRIDGVAGRGRDRMKAGDLRVAGTHVSFQVVEWNETLAIGTAIVRVIDAGIRIPDLAIFSRTPSVRVKSTALKTAQLAEVSCPLLGTRHPGVLGYGATRAASFIVEEEERSILLDWPANGGAEVVPAHWSYLDAGLIIKEVVGIELVVAQEIIGAAVEVVRARAGDEVDY